MPGHLGFKCTEGADRGLHSVHLKQRWPPVTAGARSRRSYDKNMDRDSLWWNWLGRRKQTVSAIWFSEQHCEIGWRLVWTFSYKSLWLWAQRVVTLGPDHNCTGSTWSSLSLSWSPSLSFNCLFELITRTCNKHYSMYVLLNIYLLRGTSVTCKNNPSFLSCMCGYRRREYINGREFSSRKTYLNSLFWWKPR